MIRRNGLLLFLLALVMTAAPAHADTVFEMTTKVVQDTLGTMTEGIYDDFVTGLQRPVQLFLTLFIICYGILFATGIVRASTKEFAVVMFKIAFVFAFALDSSGWAGEFIQGFFMAIVNTGSSLVLSGITGNPSRNAVHSGAGDGLAVAAGDISDGIGGCGILSFLVLLGITAWPLFAMFWLFLLTFLFAFVSAIFGFVTSLVMIAILSAFAPFFVPMALFKFTSKMFEQWLKMLVANSIQVILVFAFIGFVVRIEPWSVLTSLARVVVPYQPISFFGLFSFGPPLCTVCEFTAVNGVPTCNTPLQPIPLLQVPLQAEFYTWALTGMFSIVALGWALLQIFREVPTIAKSLSGSFYAGLGGGLMAMGGATFGLGGGGISMPGEERWAGALQAAGREVGRGSRQVGMAQVANRIGMLNPFQTEESLHQREQRALQLEAEREKTDWHLLSPSSWQSARVNRAFAEGLRYGAPSAPGSQAAAKARQELALLDQQRVEAMQRLEEATRERAEREAEEARLRQLREEDERRLVAAAATGTDAVQPGSEAADVAYMKAQLAATEARAAQQAARERLKELKRARETYERMARGFGRAQEDALKGRHPGDTARRAGLMKLKPEDGE